MNPEGDVRQSRMQEERLENEPAQAQRNFQRNQRLSFSEDQEGSWSGGGGFTRWEIEEPVEQADGKPN